MLHEDDPYWSIERVSAAVIRADAVVALTEHERDRLLESYGASLEATPVITPGVEPGEGAAYSDRDPVVLFVGRRTASKRLDILYEAMQIVWEDFPDVALMLAGSRPGVGPDPAIWIAADPRVSVIEAPSEMEKDRLLGRARVVVSSSVTESFGITTLEAWARGTPVVVTDSPVNRSVVRNGVDGLVTAGTRPTELAASLAVILGSPELAGSLGNAGRERAVAEFSWQGSAMALAQVIAE